MADITAQMQTLLTTALVGTERRTFIPPTTGSHLDGLLAQLDTGDPQGALLGAAAALSLYRRSGTLPEQMNQATRHSLPLPAEADTLPQCSPQAARMLRQILGGTYRETLPEWLHLAAKAGQRIPADLLPYLFNLMRRDEDLIPLVLPVLGERGRWLVALNPYWTSTAAVIAARATNVDIDATWKTGTQKARLDVLQQLRTSDPKHGRELLVATWKQESGAHRAPLLDQLRVGLSQDDEPFLEQALNDRRADVRKTTADLLADLPQSALQQRIRNLLLPRVKIWHNAAENTWHLRVTLPKTCNAAMQRDGIADAKPRWVSMGKQSWWAYQMVCLVPPAVWTAHLNQQPLALIRIARQGDWKKVLYDGWRSATIRHRDLAWARAFLADDRSQTALLDLLPIAEREDFIIQRLASHKSLNNGQPAVRALAHHPHAWSAKLTRTVLAGVVENIKKENIATNSELRTTLLKSAHYIDPTLIDEIRKTFTPDTRKSPAWDRTIIELLALLEFRHRLHKEFTP